MTLSRLGLLAAALSLSSCTLSTAPEPAEFKLSADALSRQYPATRKTGAVRIYAQKILTTKDEWGRETHMATGGAVLVKDSVPPIQAFAPIISVTPAYSEVLGKATVKKNGQLYIGQEDASKIRIDGTAIQPEGAHVVRAIASSADETALKAKTDKETAVQTLAAEEARVKAEADAKALALAEKEAQAKAKAEAKLAEREAAAQAKADREKALADARAQKKADAQAKADADKMATEARVQKKAEAEKVAAEAQARKAADAKATAAAKAAEEKASVKVSAEPPAKPRKIATAKPKPTAPKASTPAKPAVAVVKASTPPPAPKPKEAVPAVDRSRLLNLMREPTDR